MRRGVPIYGTFGQICGVAAIVNTAYHANGKRVRDLPITLDKIM